MEESGDSLLKKVSGYRVRRLFYTVACLQLQENSDLFGGSSSEEDGNDSDGGKPTHNGAADTRVQVSQQDSEDEFASPPPVQSQGRKVKNTSQKVLATPT